MTAVCSVSRRKLFRHTRWDVVEMGIPFGIPEEIGAGLRINLIRWIGVVQLVYRIGFVHSSSLTAVESV